MATPAASKGQLDAVRLELTQPVGMSSGRRHDTGLRIRFASFVGVVERLMDYVTVALAAGVSYGIYRGTGLGRHVTYATTEVVLSGAIFALLYVILLEKNGEYKSASLLGVRETERVLRTNWHALSLVFPVAFFSGRGYSRLVLLLIAVIAPVFLLVQRQLTYGLTQYLCKLAKLARPTLIYGSGSAARKVYSALLRSPKLGMDPVAFVDDGTGSVGREVFEAAYKRKNSAKVLPGPVTAAMLRDLNISSLILSTNPRDPAELDAILRAGNEAGVAIYFSPAHMRREEPNLEYVEIDGFMFARIAVMPKSPVYEVTKRCFDIVVSGTLILLSAPVLCMIALAIKLTSKGPIIFVQDRVGRYGRPFSMFKFRSMHVDAPKYAFSPKQVEDPRITTIGRFLRRTSFDELPQLFNVLLGHMSLVGPRPEMPFIVQRYTPVQRKRLDVTPGVTGLWQISADRAFLIHENIEYDLYYAQNRSFFLDLAILMHTALFAARGV